MRLGPVLVVAMALSAANAAEHPLAGRLLQLKDPPAAARRRVRLVVAGMDPVGDPRVVGATLEVSGIGSSGTVALRAAHWSALGAAGFRYLDPAAEGGVRKLVLRGGTLTVAGGGRGWAYRVAGPQGAIDARFRIGTDVYCARFTHLARDRRGRVLARNAPAPPDCGGRGPTPACGNGVVEPGEECDDGGPGCSATCQLTVGCGNGVLDPGEECDDDGLEDGDGCSATCRLEACVGVPGTPGTALAKVPVVSGLTKPVGLAAAPHDPTRLFVVEQPGRIRVVKDGGLLPDPFLDVSELISCCGEQGLLGIAFHPDYARNGRFFVDYTNTAGDEVVARYHVGADPDVADAASGTVLLTIPDFAPNHNGGQLAFGRDGYLYVSVGDGGGGDDPEETGQDLTRLLGKLLRLDVDVDTPPYYAVPPTNPFAGRTDARGEIWAFGLRNPWRFSFDRASGDLYIGDVGQSAWEEIDVQLATSAGGENYGWDVFEGTHCHEPTPPAVECPADPVGFTMPVLEYGHDEGCSVTGGFVYRGCALPDLRGTYFYSDLCGAFIRTFRGVDGVALEPGDRTPELGDGLAHVVSFGEDARGELYIVDYDGVVYEIVPASTPSPSFSGPTRNVQSSQ
jgi:cysteine-rich repeat protein